MKPRRYGFVLVVVLGVAVLLFPEHAHDLAGRAADRLADTAGQVFSATVELVQRVLTRF